MTYAIKPFPNTTNLEAFAPVESNFPLLVHPYSKIDFIDWAKKNQKEIAKAIDRCGIIVFRGFHLEIEDFPEAFKAMTAMPPEDAVQDEVDSHVYGKTIEEKEQTIPLHQEILINKNESIPKYLSFYCITSPEEKTGQTLVSNAKDLSMVLSALMPELWKRMKTQTLTYTARYMPKDSWCSRWIQWLNPSHPTIADRFGTEKKGEVEEICCQEGLSCKWEGGWAIVSRSGIPATIEVEGEMVFCNQIHLGRFNPKHCQSTLNYFLSYLFLYPTSDWTPLDVRFDDGSQISRSEAALLFTIIERSKVGHEWQEGDLLILDNATVLHGKDSHTGDREIRIAKGGSIKLKKDDNLQHF